MFFHSISSLIIFLPFIFITHPLISYFGKKYANLYLLFFSLFFYSFDIPWFLIPLLISSISDYFISKELIENKKKSKNQKIILLIISIFINIGLIMVKMDIYLTIIWSVSLTILNKLWIMNIFRVQNK